MFIVDNSREKQYTWTAANGTFENFLPNTIIIAEAKTIRFHFTQWAT